MAELGTAYILIEPSMQGSQATITKELTGAGEKAGQKAGEATGKSFGSGLKTVAKVGGAAIMAVGAAVAGATVALVNGAGEVASYGDNIDKMSQKMGISAQAYQEWDFIMQHSGTSMDSMKTGMVKLQNAALSGNEAFEQIGITQEQLANMSQEELFGATIAGLQNVSDDSERAYLAQQLMGKGATELGALLNTSAEETEAMRQQLHDLGGVMSDEDVKAAAAYQDSLQNLQTAGTGLKNNMIGQMLPGITTVMDGLTGLATGSEGASEQITQGVQMSVQAFNQMLPMLLQVVSGIAMGLMEAAPEILTSLGTGILTAIPTILPVIMEVVSSLVQMFISLLPQMIQVGMDVLVQLALGIAQALPTLIPTAVETILNLVMYLLDNIDLLIDAAIQLIMGLASGIIQAIPILIQKAPEIVIKLVSAIIANAPKVLEAGKQLITMLKNGIINSWNTLKSTLSSKFSEVKELLSKPFEKAKEAVTKIVDKLKNIFNFSWSLPKLKLPHFSVGTGPSVLGIQLPKINVEWYGKAKNTPYLFSSPTVVGGNGGLRGFGERGDEIVYGRENLLRDIASVTSTRPIDLDVSIIVNGAEGQNVNELADIIMEKMQNAVNRREAVFA